ncbi:MAG TPA: VWA domain-containing protein [Thermoanaerobaculia bacterium]|nr:VWA domain-containing protein [Thermoanaerobaculia bacterium]
MKDVLPLRRVWGALLALAVVLTLAATLAPPAFAQFSETADVVVVEVPVQVLDKNGEPVRGLTAADFEVSEGRKKLPVTGFEVLDLEVEAAKTADEMPTAARRHFMILFDLSFSEPKSILKARQAAADLVSSLHPTDLVAVATYSQQNGPQLILGFTPDRRQAKLALETLGLPKLMDRGPDPLRLAMTDMREQVKASQSRGSDGIERRIGDMDTVVLEELEHLTVESDRANATVIANKINAFTRSFADLARIMNGVQGRKHVVFLSEGYDSSVISGTASDEDQAAMSEAAMSGNIWEVESDKRFGSTSAGNDVEQMLTAFRQSDCIIQAVDIGGLRDSGERNARGRDALLQMARGTGGEIFENFNDLSTAMDKMLKRTSVTYVLAVQPESLKMDGAFHKLKVELKNGKNGRVSHRAGFYAPKPAAQTNPMERLFSTASQIMSGEESGPVGASVMVAPFRGGDGLAYVPVVVEVDGPSLLAGGKGTALPAEIFVYAMDEAGNVQDFLTQTMGLDLAKVQGILQQSGLKFFGHLDLPAGRYSVRVLVRNGATGAHALRVVNLDVPAFTQGTPELLPPFVPEAPGRWLMVREQPRGPQKDVPYPFMLKDQPYIPSSKPVIGPGQETQVSLVGYNLGSGDVQVSAKVFGMDGKEVGPGQIQVLARESGGAGGPDRMVGTFKAPNLQPGEYTLGVTLSAGGQSDTSFARFVVKGGAAAAARSGS